MIPTPDLLHLTNEDKLHVYDPAEDTFLLLDGLEQDAEDLRRPRPLICLEIGSGSGCVSAFLVYLTTDINHRASDCTLKTGQQNKIHLDPVTCDLARPLMKRLRHLVDIVLFNPPYVPTDTEEVLSAQVDHGISGSWAGGANGMEITNRFLRDVKDLLSEQGKFYLVALEENNIPEIRKRMFRDFSLQSQIVAQRRAGRESLYILRFTRADPVHTACSSLS
ncbi:S-adenosyl-L-methionine-dependent methyltransferase [Scleroderma yunnanense]